MHEAVLVHADVDKCAESRDVRHDSGQAHALVQVFNLVHAFGKLEDFKFFARVAAGLA